MALHLLKKDEFVRFIFASVRKDKISYIEAILLACEKFDVSPSCVKSLIPQPMKEQLEVEFIDLNLLPNESKLPI